MENKKEMYKIQCYVSKEVYDVVKGYCDAVGVPMSSFGALQIGNAALALNRTYKIMDEEILKAIKDENTYK